MCNRACVNDAFTIWNLKTRGWKSQTFNQLATTPTKFGWIHFKFRSRFCVIDFRGKLFFNGFNHFVAFHMTFNIWFVWSTLAWWMSWWGRQRFLWNENLAMFKAQWEDWGKLKLEKRKKIVSFFWLNLSALIIKFFLQFILMMFKSRSQEQKDNAEFVCTFCSSRTQNWRYHQTQKTSRITVCVWYSELIKISEEF